MKPGRGAALALLAAGTVVAALGASRLPRIDGATVAVGLVLVLAGTILARLAGGPTRTAAAGSGTLADAKARLATLPAAIDALAAEAPELPLPALAGRLADLQRDTTDPLAAEAPALLPLLGGGPFAETFGPFATAERALARARSAASDGHRGEALAALAQARAALGPAPEA